MKQGADKMLVAHKYSFSLIVIAHNLFHPVRSEAATVDLKGRASPLCASRTLLIADLNFPICDHCQRLS